MVLILVLVVLSVMVMIAMVCSSITTRRLAVRVVTVPATSDSWLHVWFFEDFRTSRDLGFLTVGRQPGVRSEAKAVIMQCATLFTRQQDHEAYKARSGYSTELRVFFPFMKDMWAVTK